MRLLFLGSLGAQLTEEIVALFASSPTVDGPAPTVLRSLSCSIEFVSPEYQSELRELRSSADGTVEFKKVRASFYRVVSQATSGKPQAEDFLFMAFVLGMLERWEAAVRLARQSLELAGGKRRSEIRYFLAVAERNLAELRPGEAGLHLRRAYRHIRLAQRYRQGEHAAPPSPPSRYVREQALIELAWHRPGGSGEASVHAMQLLEHALRDVGDDRRLRIELLNDLATVAIREFDPQWAGELVAEIRGEFQQGQGDLPEQPWITLRDTELMSRALAARWNFDEASLRACLLDFERMLAEERFFPADRRLIEEHTAEVRRWLEGGA
jgi:hypothetical protein